MLRCITLKSQVMSSLSLLPLFSSHLPAVLLCPANNKRPPHHRDIQVNFVGREMNCI